MQIVKRPVVLAGPRAEVTIGTGSLALIAGPCTLESLEMGLTVARALAARAAELGMPYVFKASFDKANRSSPRGVRGPGLSIGLEWLNQIREEVGCPVTTDVHAVDQIAGVAAVADLLQIPAFLCRQTDLLHAAGASGTPVNVKKGQFLSAAECRGLVEKVRAPCLLTERGTTFGYHDLVADLRNLPRMASHGVPIVFDCTHAVQRPGAGGDHSKGDRDLAPVLARAAVAAGVDAVFMEVHPDPDRAWSDADTQLPIPVATALLPVLERIHCIVRKAG